MSVENLLSKLQKLTDLSFGLSFCHPVALILVASVELQNYKNYRLLSTHFLFGKIFEQLICNELYHVFLKI